MSTRAREPPRFHLQLFEQTENLIKLRLLNHRHELLDERELNQEVLEALLKKRDEYYHTRRGRLAELGNALFQWLDGEAAGWISRISRPREPTSLYVTVDQKLRHLPFELILANGEFLCVDQGSTLTGAHSEHLAFEDTAQTPKNPTHCVCFYMASSPLDVRPILSFEAEEARILTATRRSGVELLVEESGTVEGLQEWVDRLPAVEIDVVHLSGHAEIRNDIPVFLSEDIKGCAKPVSAEEIGQAFVRSGRFPRLMFLPQPVARARQPGKEACRPSASLL